MLTGVALIWWPRRILDTADERHDPPSLRRIAGVSDRVAWATGTGGTHLITVEGGKSWTARRSRAPSLCGNPVSPSRRSDAANALADSRV